MKSSKRTSPKPPRVMVTGSFLTWSKTDPSDVQTPSMTMHFAATRNPAGKYEIASIFKNHASNTERVCMFAHDLDFNDALLALEKKEWLHYIPFQGKNCTKFGDFTVNGAIDSGQHYSLFAPKMPDFSKNEHVLWTLPNTLRTSYLDGYNAANKHIVSTFFEAQRSPSDLWTITRVELIPGNMRTYYPHKNIPEIPTSRVIGHLLALQSVTAAPDIFGVIRWEQEKLEHAKIPGDHVAGYIRPLAASIAGALPYADIPPYLIAKTNAQRLVRKPSF